MKKVPKQAVKRTRDARIERLTRIGAVYIFNVLRASTPRQVAELSKITDDFEFLVRLAMLAILNLPYTQPKKKVGKPQKRKTRRKQKT